MGRGKVRGNIWRL
jgi:hypothetical protein